MDYKQYKAYLKSAEWKAKKQKFYSSKLYKKLKENGKWKCFCCEEGNKALDMHHRTYKRLGHENISVDLVPVCRDCHNLIHATEKTGVQLWEATNQVRRIHRREKRK
jgi:predicted HNH restriction endonuclease